MTRTANLLRLLQSSNIPFVIDGIPSVPRGFEPRHLSALSEGRRVSVSPLQIDGQVWLAVTGDGRHLDVDLVRRSFAAHEVRKLHPEDFSSFFPGCDCSTIPPLGNLFGVPVMIDADLMRAPALTFPAFSEETTVTVRTEDLHHTTRLVPAEITSSPSVALHQTHEV